MLARLAERYPRLVQTDGQGAWTFHAGLRTFLLARLTREENSDSATALHADNQEIRAATRATVAEAARQGLLRSDDINLVQIAGRALVYGFARMQIDGHFARWGIAQAGAGNYSRHDRRSG